MGPSHEVILTHCNMHPLGLLLAGTLSFGMLLPPMLQLQDRRPRQGRDTRDTRDRRSPDVFWSGDLLSDLLGASFFEFRLTVKSTGNWIG